MKQFRMKLKSFLLVLVLGMVAFTMGCGSDGSDDPGTPIGYALFIDGPIFLGLGEEDQYEVIFISSMGDETMPSVQWSVSNLESSEAIATIDNTGKIVTKSAGVGIVTATYNLDGIDYIAALPLSVHTPGSFVVAPGAVIATVGKSPLALEAIYLGKTDAALTVSYQSSNTNVATVSSEGMISFVGTGEALITATATSINGNPVQQIPVLVLPGMDENTPLAVSNVKIDPSSSVLFLDETKQFEAVAKNPKGEIVTGEAVSWSVKSLEKDLDGNKIPVGSINNNGLFTPSHFGQAQITAEVAGVRSTALVTIVPSSVLIVTPFSTSIAVGNSRQFDVALYEVDKATRKLKENPVELPGSPSFQLLDFGFPDLFGIGSVSSDGVVTIKEDATPGMSGYLMVSLESDPLVAPGFSTVIVAVAENCNCGASLENASSIFLESDQMNLSLLGTNSGQISAVVQDEGGTVLLDASIVYCSDNDLVATVDESGFVVAGGLEGSATIKVCHGDLSTTVTVNVTF